MSYRLKALANAASHLGVKEHPPNSNHGPQIDRWCKRTNGIPGGYPWCASFLYCMFDDAGLDLKKSGLVGPSLVQNWVTLARARGWVVQRPFKGDVCCFDWDANGMRDHIGVVEKVRALRWRGRVFVGWVTSIEGNTSATDQSNGGEVQRRRRWLNGAQVYIRIPGP